MAFLEFNHSQISGIVASIPKNEESSNELLYLSDSEKKLLIKTIGIDKRRVSPKDMKASDLCFYAAIKLLNELNWQREDIDLLVFVTQSPDYVIPTTSACLQTRLGLSEKCITIDVNQGCAGYVYGLSIVNAYMSSSGLKKALLLVGDTITHYIKKGDYSLQSIFSDAGSCTAVEKNLLDSKSYFNLQSDGTGFDVIHLKKTQNQEEQEYLKMNGHEVFNFGLREVAKNANALLKHFQIDKNEINFLVLHQANKLLNDMLRKQLGFTVEQTPSTLEKYGNTSCATIPLTMVSELGEILETSKKKLLLSGFGVGLTWGSVFVEIDKLRCCKLIEV